MLLKIKNKINSKYKGGRNFFLPFQISSWHNMTKFSFCGRIWYYTKGDKLMAKQNNNMGCWGWIIQLFAWIIMICFIMYIGIAIAGVVCVIGAIYGIFRLIKWIIHKKRIKNQDGINNTDFEKNELEIQIQDVEKIQVTTNEIEFTDNSQCANNIDLINDYQLENPHVDTPQEIIYEEPITEIKEEDVIEETNIPYTEQAEPKEEIEQKEKQKNNSEEREIKKPMEVIEVDEYFEEAGRFVIESKRAAAGQLQRKFSIGFNRVGRIIDQLHKAGVVVAADGTNPRKILMTIEEFEKYLSETEIKIIQDYVYVDTKKEVLVSEERVNIYNNKYDYMTGEDFEVFIAQILKKIGYFNVYVTKKSGDQGVDIIAEQNNIRYAIQCKRYSEAVGNRAVQEVFAGKTFYNCDIGVVVTNSYFTQSAKDLASRNGIVLWDRNELENLISLSELAGENNLFYEWVELSDDEIKYFCEKIINAFKSYNIYLSAGECFVDQGMTKYCFFPKSGTRLKNILSCKEDVSFFVGTVIDIMPNYEKGVIEIELPNKIIKEIVCKEDKLKKF